MNLALYRKLTKVFSAAFLEAIEIREMNINSSKYTMMDIVIIH